jgi:YHS domain-containing protein
VEGLLSLLLVGGLLVLLLRYRHGADVLRGGPVDPWGSMDHVDHVCGMTVDPASCYGKMYQGRLYRFCSWRCLEKFEADPARYLVPKQPEGNP